MSLSDDQIQLVREAISDYEENGGLTLEEVKRNVGLWKKEKIKSVS